MAKKQKQRQPKPQPQTEQQAKAGVFQALSLCRRAGKLVMGFDAVVEAVMNGETECVLTAADVSENTEKRLCAAVQGLAEVQHLPLAQDELLPISRKAVAVYAVTDSSLARLCAQKREQFENLSHKEEISE